MTDNTETTTVKRGGALRRFLWMVVIPVLAVTMAAGIYLRGGRFVTSENAYVKSNIVIVSTDVSGRALPGIVANNQRVKKNQLLFRIDAADFDLRVAKAAAAMELVRTEVETQRAALAEVKVSMTQAQERIDYYQRQYQRHQSLKKEGIGSAQAADDALFNLRSAQQRIGVLTEQSNRMLTAFDGNPDMPVEQHPAYAQALVAYREAQLELEKTEIRAPVDGVVSNVSLQPGEYVESGSAVFSLVEEEQVWIEANLKETQLTHVREGQVATITVDAFPQAAWDATVTTIAPTTGAEFALLPPQNATGNWVKVVQRIPVNLTLDAAPNLPALRAGMTATVQIDTRHQRQLTDVIAPLMEWLPDSFNPGAVAASLQAAELPDINHQSSKALVAPDVERIQMISEMPASETSAPVIAAAVSTTPEVDMPEPEAEISVNDAPPVMQLPLAPTVSVDPVTPQESVDSTSMKLLGERWIRDVTGDFYTLQLGTSSSRHRLEQYARTLPVDTPVLIYFHRYDEEKLPVYALAVGIYKSRQSARAALGRLPEDMTRFKPWIRRIADLKASLKARDVE